MPVIYSAKPPKQGPSPKLIAAIAAPTAIALALLGYIAWSQWQQQTIEQYICIPHEASPNCQSLKPRFIQRNML